VANKNYRILTVEQARVQARVEGDEIVEIIGLRDVEQPEPVDTDSSGSSDIGWGFITGCAVVATLVLFCVGAFVIASLR